MSATQAPHTNNDDFLSGMTLGCDPIYAVQVHLIYNLGAGVWGALDATDYTGGRTTVDGVKGDNLQENTHAWPHRRAACESVQLDQTLRQHGEYSPTPGATTRVGSFWPFRWAGGL